MKNMTTRIVASAAFLAIVIAIGPPGSARADLVNYDVTQAGATAPSGIRPGDIVTALSDLVLQYNNGMSWTITLGDDPVRVLETNPVPQDITLGELMTHNDESLVIYDRLAVRAVLQWIGYDSGELPVVPQTLGYLTDEGFFDLNGDLWVLNSGASANPDGPGKNPLPLQIFAIPEPSTLAITVIAGSVVMNFFRRRRYGDDQ